ncbi:MAG: glycosyltransferase, partial [Rhodospirillaceae bacterium]
STDDTCERLAAEFDAARVIVLPGAHAGIAAAKNRALRGGTGEIRGILDSDDLYLPQFVARCVEALVQYPAVGLVYTDNYHIDSRGSRTVQQALDWSLRGLLQSCNLRGDSWLCWWSTLCRTRLHDERFELEVDYDLFYSLSAITDFIRIPSVLQTVRTHPGRVTADRQRAAYWHAAALAKHGYSIEYAYMRAGTAGALDLWRDAIAAGYRHGQGLRL